MIKKVFLILSITVFASSLGDGIVSPLLPLYIEKMGGKGVWLGIIVAALFISNSIAIPISGRLSDQKGRKAFIVTGFAAISVISLGYLWAGQTTQLALVRFAHGAAGALIAPIALAYLGDLAPEGEEGRWMGYANAAFFSGFGLGPFFGGLLIDHFGMRAGFITMSSVNLFAFLVALVFLPEVAARKGGGKPHISFKKIRSGNMVKGLFSFRLAQALGAGAINVFLPIFAAAMGLSTSLIGLLLSISILSVTLLNPAFGILADKLNRRTLTILSSFILAGSLAATAFAGNFWLLLVVLLIQGIGFCVSGIATQALVVDEGRRLGMGSMMSVLFLSQGIGMAFGPIAAGGIEQLLDVKWVFYFGGAIGLVGTALFAWYTRTYTPVANGKSTSNST